MLKSVTTLAAFALLPLLAACTQTPTRQSIQSTDNARIIATPKATPQRTITNFSNSLRCMDSLLMSHQTSEIGLGILSNTGEASFDGTTSGVNDMLLTALSTMSRRSNSLRVHVATDSPFGFGDGRHEHFDSLEPHGTPTFNQTPSSAEYFIKVSPVQTDSGVYGQESAAHVGLGIGPRAEIGNSVSQSVVSMDMNLGSYQTMQLISGVTSSNSIAVGRNGNNNSLTGIVSKLDAQLNVRFERNEGMHHSVRTLIDLGAVELVGKLARVPYWECLDIAATEPSVQQLVHDWYRGLSNESLNVFVKDKLQSLGYLQSSSNNSNRNSLRTAIAKYKHDKGLVSNGTADFLLYYTLITDEARQPKKQESKTRPPKNDPNPPQGVQVSF